MSDPMAHRFFRDLAVPAVHGWRDTPLPDPAGWSQVLDFAVRQVMQATAPAGLLVGPDQRLVYNPRLAALLGPLHPRLFGAPVDPPAPGAREWRLAGHRLHAEFFPLPDDSRATLFLVWPSDPGPPLAEDLRAALRDDLLHVHYQPLVRLSDGTLAGFEALARWRHPTLGEIGPEVFIPLAEATAQIDRIGLWILRRSLMDFGTLACADRARLAVNVSPLQLRDPGFADHVAHSLAASGLPPARLELEITEAMPWGDDPQLARSCAALGALGVELVLDDFGAGYSNIGVLAKFPFSRVKLDRGLVADLAHPRTRRMIRALCEMAHDLGMELTVEGVETEAQARTLRDLGCDLAQGYHFSAPLALSGARRWLARQDRGS